ncbi:MAG: hypothetical protein HOJ02_09365 [Rhodospirillaceae bacterium]|nr:hypothetical protein [Rhodospirillaceae bacterium]
MKTKKKILFALISVLIAIVGTLIAAELLIRLLPYNEGLRAMPVNAKTPIFHFQPGRAITWSEGWDFAIINQVRVNNDGFVNGQDYDPQAETPLLAIIGDSYIESGIVPYAETVQGRLAKLVEDKGRVYSFAASGAGLSQYLVWAAYARDTYHPDGFVFSIIGNDFSESLYHREHSPGFHHFRKKDDGSAELMRIDYEPSLVRRIFRNSALAMYLVTNANLPNLLNFSLNNLGKDDKRWVANIPATSDEEILADFRWAVDSFLDALPQATGLPMERITLTFDGFRPQMYEDKLDFALTSVWAKMRDYMIGQATARGINIIDLHPVFMERFAEEGKRFEFPTDSHWNPEGHRAVTDAIAKSGFLNPVFD